LRPTAAACLLLALLASGCGGSTKALNASSARLPSLRKWCGGSADGEAKVGWFRATDGVLLDGATLGTGKTGVVLAHESPADLCGWAGYAGVLSRAGVRVLFFDHRHFGLSQRLVLFPGGYHGWDILDVAPYRARASRLLIDFLHHPD
jgi:pimeloyl-ACP methyl ester carboxylesterase